MNRIDRAAMASAFLGKLFGELPEDGLILIWTLDQSERCKESHWFPSPAEAAEFATSEACDGRNVYVGVGWQTKNKGRYARGGNDDIAGIVGLWADIDVAGPGHKNNNYPTEEVALKIIASLPLEPTIMVWTGGGWHCWWLLREPWIFEDDADRDRASALVLGWGRRVQRHGQETGTGYRIDSVWDLARVLRVPGTYRTKPEDPEPKLVIARHQGDGAAFNPSDFAPFIEDAPPGEAIAVEVGGFTIDPNANPPLEKFELLCEIEPKFRLSWQRKRKDLKDQSQSGYDMSLALFAAKLQWTDQEIVNLLIAAHRKHGQSIEKSLKERYLKNRIRVARGMIVQQQRTQNEAEVRSTKLEEIDEAVERGADRGQLLGFISDALGVQITAVRQEGAENAVYWLVLEGGQVVTIGGILPFMTAQSFRLKLAEACRHLIPEFKPAEWKRVVNALLRALEVSSTVDSTREGQVMEWINTYLAARQTIYSEGNWADALHSNDPFTRDGQVAIHAGSLHTFVRMTLFAKVEIHHLRQMLRQAGFKARTVSGQVDGTQTSRSYWHLDSSLLYPQDRGTVDTAYTN